MEKFKNFTLKLSTGLKQFLTIAGKVLLVLTIMLIGFFAGEFIRHYQEKDKSDSNLPPVKTTEDILVSFTSGGEIVFIDKESGECEIFSDSISMMIFNHHAMKLHYKTQN